MNIYQIILLKNEIQNIVKKFTDLTEVIEILEKNYQIINNDEVKEAYSFSVIDNLLSNIEKDLQFIKKSNSEALGYSSDYEFSFYCDDKNSLDTLQDELIKNNIVFTHSIIPECICIKISPSIWDFKGKNFNFLMNILSKFKINTYNNTTFKNYEFYYHMQWMREQKAPTKDYFTAFQNVPNNDFIIPCDIRTLYKIFNPNEILISKAFISDLIKCNLLSAYKDEVSGSLIVKGESVGHLWSIFANYYAEYITTSDGRYIPNENTGPITTKYIREELKSILGIPTSVKHSGFYSVQEIAEHTNLTINQIHKRLSSCNKKGLLKFHYLDKSISRKTQSKNDKKYISHQDFIKIFKRELDQDKINQLLKGGENVSN